MLRVPLLLTVLPPQVDLVDRAVVTAEEVETLARKLGLRLYRT